jgi:hypothetical protein
MVQLIDGCVPSDGDRFDIFDFGLVAGDFQQLHLPPLPDDLLWNTTSLAAEGILAIETAVTTLAGDFNNDGTVDAADYTVWRDGDGATGTAPIRQRQAMLYGWITLASLPPVVQGQNLSQNPPPCCWPFWS